MSAPLTPDRLVRILRDEGLDVHEYRDWRWHSRNHKGAWGPVNGVMIHHTVTRGTDATVELCYEGYSSLPGPLCHGVIAKDGSVHLVGNGRANHAGLGDDDVMDDVIAERELSPDNEANTDGNARFYGFECVNLGDGEDPWPAAQLDAIERVSAAICRHHGWKERSVIGHKEWQPGKVDPRGFSMDRMRDRIARRLAGPAGTDTEREASGMQLSDDVELNPWVPRRWPEQEGLQDGAISVRTALGSGYAYGKIAAECGELLVSEVIGLRKEVAELRAAGGVDGAQLEAAAEAGAAAVLRRLGAAAESG